MINNKLNSYTQQGFSLIEVVLYSALSATVLIAIILFNINILKSYNKTKTIFEVQQNARIAMNRMVYEIRQAQDLNVVSATQLSLTDINGNTITFNASTGTLIMSRTDVGQSYSLTSDKVNVDSLNFTDLTATGGRDTVRVEMAVSRINPNNLMEMSYSVTLITTVMKRDN